MIIGIDGNEANIERRVGIGQYAYQVLKHIYRIRNSEFGIRNNVIKFKIYLKDAPLNDLPLETDWWRYEVYGPRILWTQLALPLKLQFSSAKPDVFFSPSHYAPRFTSIPQYISVMDMSFVRYPELFTAKDRLQLIQWTAYSVKKARKIFTISEFSKKEIVEIYHIPANNVVVTYPGYNRSEFRIQNSEFRKTEQISLRKKYNISNDYILFVGTLQPRKNIKRLIEAYKLIMQKYKSRPLDLVIIGKRGWLYEEIFSTITTLGIEKKVHIMDFVADDDLRAFYSNAQCFVLPSFYEGFGIPIVEAMTCGCPVVVSNVSSLPEIAAKAAFYIDPKSIEDIARGIEKVLRKGRLRKELIEKGLQQARRFSWEQCAQITLKTLVENDK